MKHTMGAKNMLLTSLLFAQSAFASTPAVRDNESDCDCFLVSGEDAGYFQNHRFIDFRSIVPGDGEDFTIPPPLVTDSEDQGAEDVTSSYFNSPTYTNDWFYLNGNTNHTNRTVDSIDSARNIFIFQDNDSNSTYLALRAYRLENFVSNAEMDTVEQDFFYGSFRTRARLVPAITTSTAPQPYINMDTTSIPGLNDTHPIAPGAVFGFFTYLNETEESDIEILTSDPTTHIHYSNQPDYDFVLDQPVTNASTEIVTPASIDWTDWHEHRVDWFEGESRWYIDGQFYLSKTVNVPTAPSALLLNLWSDGGLWSLNMTVGAQVIAAFEWVEMAYNVTENKEGQCARTCRVDDVAVVGTPEAGDADDGDDGGDDDN